MGNPDFEPERKLIGAITNAPNAVVTTTANHGYTTDETVCIIVPLEYGMHLDFVENQVSL